MSGVQRFLTNADSVIDLAILSASAVKSATDTAKLRPGDREGRGLAKLTGAFTGDKDAVYDVEVTSEAVGTVPQVSDPVFTGAGNGSISDLAIDAGGTAQTYRIALKDLGTETTKAEATIEGQKIIAREAGPDGNNLFLEIDSRDLVVSESQSATFEKLTRGAVEVSGEEWDFGGLPLLPDGTLNPNSPRIRFGNDEQIYRQYSEFRGGETFYRFVPSIIRDVAKDTPVFNITGSRSVSVAYQDPETSFGDNTTAPAVFTDRVIDIAEDEDGRLVGVSDAGEIAYSDDGGATWTAAATNPLSAKTITGLSYIRAYSRWFAGASDGSIAWSDDGDDWTIVGDSKFGANAVYDFAGSVDRIVAVGASGIVSTSADAGLTWTKRSDDLFGNNVAVYKVVHALDRFVAAGASGRVASSPAGLSWANVGTFLAEGAVVNALFYDESNRRLLLGTGDVSGTAAAEAGQIAISEDLGQTWDFVEGLNQLNNSGFNGALASWKTIATDGTVAVVSGVATLTQDSVTAEHIKLYQALPTVAGAVYRVRLRIKTATTALANTKFGVSSSEPSGVGASDGFDLSGEQQATEGVGIYSCNFTATGATSYVVIQNSGAVDDVVAVDDVTAHETTHPLGDADIRGAVSAYGLNVFIGEGGEIATSRDLEDWIDVADLSVDAWAIAADGEGSFVIAAGDDGVDGNVAHWTAAEVYPGIITQFDFFESIRQSALVELDGVATNDARPGGQASLEFQVRTASVALPVSRSSDDMERLIALQVAASAPTENIFVQCIDNQIAGSEIWRVFGGLRGEVGIAETGKKYNDGSVSFIIPRRPSVSGVDEIRIESASYASRSEGEKIPPIGLRFETLGANASQSQITFKYEKRPDLDACDPELAAITGRVRPSLLGLEDLAVSEIADEVLTRWQSMYEWRKDFIDKNTYTIEGGTTVYYSATNDGSNADYTVSLTDNTLPESFLTDKAYYIVNTEEIDFAFPIFDLLRTSLLDIFEDAAALTAWDSLWTTFKTEFEPLEYAATVDRVTRFGRASIDLFRIESFAPLPVWSYLGDQRKAFPTAAELQSDDYEEEYFFDLSLRHPTVTGLDCDNEPDQLVRFKTNHSSGLNAAIIKKYEAELDDIYIDAGILPKTNAQGGQTGAWSDLGGAFWWVAGNYLPAFTNHVYHSSKGTPEENYSTEEFAFAIAVKCTSDLKEGDSITVQIGGAGTRPRYSVGDVYTIPVVAGSPLNLSGGKTGTDTKTWAVTASVDGALPDYVQTVPPPLYDEQDLQFKISPGGVPFELGDRFDFQVEGGAFRWRRDGGAWSSPADITDAPVALDLGVSVEFSRGKNPSFVTNDLFTFDVLQPASVDHLKRPDLDRFKWAAAGVTITADLGGSKMVDAVAIARHSIPEGATLTLEGSTDGFSSVDWSESLTWQKGPIVKLFTEQTATHVRLITDVAGSIGWFFVGSAASISCSAEELRLRKVYDIRRGPRSASFAGSGDAGFIGYESFLKQADIDEILRIVDHSKQNGDEPLILVPHFSHTEDARLIGIDADEVELEDLFEYQSGERTDRLLSARIPLSAVID